MEVKKSFFGRSLFSDILSVAAGALLFSLSLNMFLLPAGIVLGGFTGIATLIKLYFGVPVGLMILILNLPLIIWNTKLYGRGFLARTLVGLLATSIVSDAVTHFPVTVTDPFLCALFGGLAMGAGCGILFVRGFTTGGTDLIAWAIKYRWKRLSTGNLIFLCDGIIIALAALVRWDFTGMLYSALAIYTSSRTVDFLLDGEKRARLILIFSRHQEGICRMLLTELERGVTIVKGVGGYTGEAKNILFCVVKPPELYRLKQKVQELDPAAFVVACEVSEVLGEGFSHPT